MNGNAHTHQFVVFIDNESQQFEAENAEIHTDVVFYLALCQRGISIKAIEGLVNELENFLSVIFFQFFARRVFEHTKVVSFCNDIGNTFIAFGHFVAYADAEFHPVGILFEAHTFHVSGVVGMVVDGGLR